MVRGKEKIDSKTQSASFIRASDLEFSIENRQPAHRKLNLTAWQSQHRVASKAMRPFEGSRPLGGVMLCPTLFFPLFPNSTLTTRLDNSPTNSFGSPNPTHVSRGELTSCSFQTSIHKATCLPAEYKSLVPTSLTIMLLLPELS